MELQKRRRRQTPIDIALAWKDRRDDPEGFEVRQFGHKGRGVVTLIKRYKGDFLLVYKGELLNATIGEDRESEVPSGFRYFYQYKEKMWCIDATEENGSLGRLVNHGERKERNAVMKVLDGHLYLFCLRDIDPGNEILYDYGIPDLPWKKIKNDDSEASADVSNDGIVVKDSNIVKSTDVFGKEKRPHKKKRMDEYDCIEEKSTKPRKGRPPIGAGKTINKISASESKKNTKDLHVSTISMNKMLSQSDEVDSYNSTEDQTSADEMEVDKDNLKSEEESKCHDKEKQETNDNDESDMDTIDKKESDNTTENGQQANTEELDDSEASADVSNDGIVVKDSNIVKSTDVFGKEKRPHKKKRMDEYDCIEEKSTKPRKGRPPIGAGKTINESKKNTKDLHVSTISMNKMLSQSDEVDSYNSTEDQTSADEMEVDKDNLKSEEESKCHDKEIQETNDNDESDMDTIDKKESDNTTENGQQANTEELDDSEASADVSNDGIVVKDSEIVKSTDVFGKEKRPHKKKRMDEYDCIEEKSTKPRKGIPPIGAGKTINKISASESKENTKDLHMSSISMNKMLSQSDEVGSYNSTKDQTSADEMEVDKDNLKSEEESKCLDKEKQETNDNDESDMDTIDKKESDNTTENGQQANTEELDDSEASADVSNDGIVVKDSEIVKSTDVFGKEKRPHKKMRMDEYDCIEEKSTKPRKGRPPIGAGKAINKISASESKKNTKDLHISHHFYMPEGTYGQSVAIVKPVLPNTGQCMDSDSEDYVSDSCVSDSSNSYEPSEPSSDDENSDDCSGDSDVVPIVDNVKVRKEDDTLSESDTTIMPVVTPSVDSADESYIQRRASYFKNITVEVYKIEEGKKRNYRKTDYCLFCKGRYESKISKHLMAVHFNEAKVREATALPFRSKERRAALQRLQNEGNFNHNVQVLQEGRGTLVVYRRPKNCVRCASEFIPCEYCLAFVHEKMMWSHAKSCYYRPGSVDTEKNYIRNGRVMLIPFMQLRPENERTSLDEIISKMKETTQNPGLKEICNNDVLIREFGNSLLDKLGTNEEQRRKDQDNIRTKLRSVGRLLQKLNDGKLTEQPLDHFICGSQFMTVVTAVKDLSREANSPNLALTLGHYLKQICLLKVSLSVQTDNVRRKGEAYDFKELYSAHWNSKVSCVANRTMKLRCINKKEEIPCTEDLVKLKDYLQKEIQIGIRHKKPTYEQYVHFASVLLARILLFNKRRIAEVDELKIEDFQKRMRGEQIESNSEIVQSLAFSEATLLKRMHLVEVRGKSTRGLRKVYILLTPDMVQGMEHILQSRIYAGVNPNNIYVFGRSNDSLLDGCGAMRMVTETCPGLAKPGLIRSRLLRKYLATTSQIMDMTGPELKLVADHMGHSVEIHTNIYKLQSSILERTKVARALIALENGQMKEYKGKTLESINVDVLPAPVQLFDDEEDDDEDNTEKKMEEESVETMEEVEEEEETVADEEETVTEEKIEKRSKRVTRKRWTRQEEEALMKAFSNQFKSKTNVTTREIKAAMNKYKHLNDRTEAQIRSKVNNIVLGKAKLAYFK